MIWLLLALAAAFADWVAVAREDRRLRYVFKPLTIVLLLAGAAAADGALPILLLTALVLSLAGDVFLMLPSDRFVPGLAAFLAAHVAYIALFLQHASTSPWWWFVAAGVVVIAGAVGMRIVHGLLAGGSTALVAPVICYSIVITGMALAALATGSPWVILGAALFYASDSLIGWNRFVRPSGWGPLAIIVTYHLGQIGLTAGALRLAG